MKTLFYVAKREFINRLKKALRRPVTYLFAVFIIGYIGILLFALKEMMGDIHFDNPAGLAIVITVLIFVALPSSYMMYAMRKGIIFKPSHAHFIFSAPISPKRVLLFGALKNILMDLIFGIAIFVIGILFFSVSVWKMLLVFVLWVVMTALQESAIVVLLYGNDKVSAQKVDKAGKVLLGVLVLLGLFVAWYIHSYGLSVASVAGIFEHPVLQMLPLIGWNIATFRLVILGATTVNVVCTCLYFLSTAVLVFAAWKMECTGGYYEEAAKFADDYQALRQRNKRGETGTGKEKYRHLKSGMAGKGASAIFHRHFLEYKKARFFIFNSMDLVSVFIAFVMAKAYDGDGKYASLFLLGIVAYVVFCTSGAVGKWEKELNNPYLYLIPARPIEKLWYATLMEHIKSLIDGTIIYGVIGVSWHVPIWQIVSCILIYVLFQADKMYMRIFAIYILGDHFGTQLRNLFRMLIQSSVMGIGIFLAVMLGVLIDVNFVFPALLIYGVVITAIVMVLAAGRFEVLEQID
ncbi:putative ABC exporter domain-containing protein [Roseburia hominis]